MEVLVNCEAFVHYSRFVSCLRLLREYKSNSYRKEYSSPANEKVTSSSCMVIQYAFKTAVAEADEGTWKLKDNAENYSG